MPRRYAVMGTFMMILFSAVLLAQAQGGGSNNPCPPGCTFVCTIPDPQCGCYGYCSCSGGQGTLAPTPTPAPVGTPDSRLCYRTTYYCSWSCPDPAQGQLKTMHEYIDCVTGELLYGVVVSTGECGSCRLLRDCRQPGACTPTPVRATPTPGPTPTAEPCGCPGPQEILGTPSYNMSQFPPYPIVVGQGGQGITIRLSVTIPDWILRKSHKEIRRVCVEGDPAPGQEACTMPDGTPGHWEWRDHEWRNGQCVPFCASHDESYPEYATGGTIRLQLRQSSIQWIQSELAARYPGARVYQAMWERPARVIATYDAGNATIAVLEAYFPVRDPGYYDVSAVISTNKRTLTYVSLDPARAYLIDTTIIR